MVSSSEQCVMQNIALYFWTFEALAAQMMQAYFQEHCLERCLRTTPLI